MRKNQYRAWAGDSRVLSQVKVQAPVVSMTQVCTVCHKTYEVAKYEPASTCSGCLSKPVEE